MPFFRLLGDTNGDGVVTGPYSTAGTDAYTVYHAEGETGTLLNADVNGDGAVNSKDLTETAAALGHAVGTTAPSNFPQFQLLAGASAAVPVPVNATLVTQSEVQALMPAAIDAWQGAGLDAADVRKLENVPVQVGNLGTSILGLEAAGVIMINQTAAGYNWYVNAGSASSQAFGLMGPVGEFVAAPGSPVANEVDLLTVLEHELGHVLGLADNAQAGDIMDITLGLAVSRTPTSADLAAIASPSKIAIDVPVFDTATPALINQNPAVPNGTQPGVLNVSVPMLPVNVTPLSSSPSNGPISQAAVDAALAAILNPAGGNSDDQDATSISGSSARPADRRLSGLLITNRRKGRSTEASARYPHGSPSSRFTSRFITAALKTDRPE